jgi:hypothetical protein
MDEVKADHGDAGDGEIKAWQCCRFLWPKMGPQPSPINGFQTSKCANKCIYR